MTDDQGNPLEPPTELDAINVLGAEQPKVLVITRTFPPAVLIVAQYPSGALTLPLTTAQARDLAAGLLEGADNLDREGQAN